MVLLFLLIHAIEQPKARASTAVVLLSGGLDSATVAAHALHEGFRVIALSIDYGQRHRTELTSAVAVARSLGVTQHHTVQVALSAFGGSALTASSISVPKHARWDEKIDATHIPVTYVPARNTVFLALALSLCETLGAFDLFFGANALDYSGYPDCRPEFIHAFEALANVATKDAVEGKGRYRVHAPLLHLSKAEIVLRAVELGVDVRLTHSCYDPVNERHCGACDACVLRRRGFLEANVRDPTEYHRAT